MKRLSLIFVLVILLAGCAVGPMSAPSCAQGYGGYNYPPPPQNPYATPWVGNNTPWTFYQGDWFLNGILYQFFGNQYGWAPYYAYPPTYIVRPNNWYAPQWNAWYQRNPHYWQTFEQKYPYWRGHRVGQRYDENFYNKYHRGQGEGWNKGFHGVRPPGAHRPVHSFQRSHQPGRASGPAHRSWRPSGSAHRSRSPSGSAHRSQGRPAQPSRSGRPSRTLPALRRAPGSGVRPVSPPSRSPSGSAHRSDRPSLQPAVPAFSPPVPLASLGNWSPCPWRA